MYAWLTILLPGSSIKVILATIPSAKNYCGFLKKVRTYRKRKATCMKKKKNPQEEKKEPTGRKNEPARRKSEPTA